MRTIFISIIAVTCGLISQAQVWLESTVIDTQVVATNLEVPWELESWSNDTILFTERSGQIKRLSLESGQIDVLYGPSPEIAVEGHSGLLGMQIHPNFPEEPFIYIAEANYVGSTIRLFVKRLKFDDQQDLLLFDSTIVSDINGSSTNLGGRMLISSEGLLYIAVGDLKRNETPQDLTSLNGKVLRYTLTGSIPEGNPFPNSPVFSLGHRNPQGITEDVDGNIWLSEHGASSNDELNKLESGRNYGWPIVVGECTTETQDICDSLNIAEPFVTWSPTIAPAGILFYEKSTIPEWTNSALITSLKEQRIVVAHFNQDKSEVTHYDWVFQNQLGRIRDILMMPNGRLFVCTSNQDILGVPKAQDDIIMEFIPSQHSGTISMIGEPLEYQIVNNSVVLSKPITGHARLFSIDGRLLESFNLEQSSQIDLPTMNVFVPQVLNIRTENINLNIKRFAP